MQKIYLSFNILNDDGLFPQFCCVTSRREHLVQVIPNLVYQSSPLHGTSVFVLDEHY